MPKKKPEHEKAKKLSISIPRAIWNLAEIRMVETRAGESEYIRDLIKKDTHALWMQQQNMPTLMAAEDPAPYGAKRASAQPAPSSSVSLKRKKTD